ncbi:ABC transporter ATP-binding protein [Pedobacter flavus]|uniref:ABC transporter ATP-binding protein n=1 Tax=Pedobacter flavus TaxID=3113906 RepID=A0ABU7GYY1_9SPHI|nr:ABC transporter ATP-binding protein [Pedobacter sp. VNH31]MEE1884272.1 ABC transporter ATP-binding protein [Pedobacter sp. VNH31]
MITIKDLHFGYSPKRVLFKDISLSLKAGHIYGLLGKNGAGKSTLLKNIAGLVYAQGGEISVLGFDPSKRHPGLLEEIFFVPEELFLPALNLDAFVRINASFYPKFDHNYFATLLREFDVPMAQKLSEMSYGQKKKMIICFGLASQTKLIIMDEPTNGLDIPSKAQFRKIMASALTEDRCIIISTHQVRDLDNLIDTVIMLDSNKLALMASVEEITEKLTFKNVDQLQADVIYAEPSLNGYHAILPNRGDDYSKLDIELLFNAIVLEKEKINQHFNA